MSDPRARELVTEHFGVRESLQWQPWVAAKKNLFAGKGGPVALRYRFTSRLAGSEAPMAFVAEKLVGMKMAINGREVSTQTNKWWIDRRFGRVDISPHVVAGENVVELRFTYGLGSEIEPAFVVGNFGVELTRADAAEITPRSEKVEPGPWTVQGLPFYVGVGWYRFTFDLADVPSKLAELQIRDAKAILLDVRLNGEPVGVIPWRPWTLNLLASGKLKVGANELEIGVVASLRNAFGPMHDHKGEREMWVGPDSFERDWTDAYVLYDYGLHATPQLRLA